MEYHRGLYAQDCIQGAEFILFGVAIVAVLTKNDVIIEKVKKIVE